MSIKTVKASLFFLGVLVMFSCQEREFDNPFDPQVPKTLSTSVLPAGAGTINVSPGGTSFTTDQVVTLIPEPSQHWVFKNWQGDASGSTNPLSLTMSTNKSVVAIFIRRNYPLTLTMEGEGTVGEKIVFTPSGRDYPHSTIVELTPVPKQGWLFDSWSGDLTGKNVPQNITIDNPKTVRAKFVQQQISNLACASALNSGNLVATLPANVVSTAIPYTTVSGGAFIGQSITSTGVTGLTATLLAGSFAPVSGNLNFSITGTPAGSGTASFAISIGGQTCTFTRVVNPLGTISGLNCGDATNNGALNVGVIASNVTSIIPYTGGNGSAYLGQIITSTGVTGLTATLAAGNFANGNGTLTYTITGTPSAIGNATFALNIGGRTCTLFRSVNQNSGPGTILNDLNQIQYVNNSIAYAVGDGLVIKSLDGGVNWGEIKSSNSLNFTAVYFVNASIGYLGGNDQYYSYLFRTLDGGLTWQQLNRYWFQNQRNEVTSIFSSTTGERVVALINRYPNATQVYGYMVYSTNSGASWNSIQASRDAGFNTADLVNGTIFIGGNGFWTGTAYRTSVYTTTFLVNSSPELTEDIVGQSSTLFSFHQLDMVSNFGFGTIDDGRLAISSDNGKNWTLKTLAGSAAGLNLTAVLFPSSSVGYIGTSSGMILKTEDSGFSWSSFFQAANEVTDLALRPDGKVVAIGKRGLIRVID